MLQRLAILMALMALLILGMQTLGPGTYFSMQLKTIDNKPCLVLENFRSSSDGAETFFSIYTPSGKNWDEWVPLVMPKKGRAYGVFAAPAASEPRPTESGPLAHARGSGHQRLGILHEEERVTLFNPADKDAKPEFEVLPFKWPAETAAMIQGVTYVFGVDLPPYEENKRREGPLKAARYDGKQWEELKVSGPKVAVEKGTAGFSLQAIEFQGGIRLFWRHAEADQALGQEFEGPRASGSGPLMMAAFDGETFQQEPTVIQPLPRGNFTAWAAGDSMRLLIQCRAKVEDAFSSNGAMEFYKLSAEGALLPDGTIEKSRAKSGLLPFIAAERLEFEGQEFIVRSNWQSFEIWRRTPERGWTRVTSNPKGLPVYDLEAALLWVLAIGLAFIAFGAGLAYHRRRQAWTLVRKVQANELYASLALRTGAFAVDLGLILAAAVYLSRWLGWPSSSPLRAMLEVDLLRLPHGPFFAVYIIYLAGAEWLFGTTLGKLLMGLCVVDDAGQKLSLWAALVRNLIGFYERLPLMVFVPITMIVFGPRRQRLGDILARTFVVQKAALEVFKSQRAQELARRLAESGLRESSANAPLLPPLHKLWDTGKKEDDSASSDKNEKK